MRSNRGCGTALKISAIICTHNRYDLLPKAIESLIDQTIDKTLYEIIVVDNASTDDTIKVCEQYSSQQNMRYIYEPAVGLSEARNRGAKEACGKYVAYMDDDAIASRGWLEKILFAFEEVSPLPVSVGGKINPIWEVPNPSWLPDYKKPYLTILDYGDTPTFLKHPQILYGTNMAFEKEVLLRFGGFRTDIGRKKRKLLGGEDMEIFMKLSEDSLPVYYMPEASVSHLVPKERLTKEWLYSRHYWQGRSEVLLVSERLQKGDVFHEIRKAFAMIFKHSKELYRSKREDDQFSHSAIIRQQIGRLVQLMVLLKE